MLILAIRLCTLLSLLSFVTLPTALAEETSKLGVGSSAPPLEAAAMIKGHSVDLSKGLHVIDLWATWCGPCIESVPHLTEMAKKFAGKADVTGVAIMEQGDAQERVKAFVKTMGDKMDYNVAYDGRAGAVEKEWYKASGQAGIPTAFLVKDGKIAWIGHPMSLERVLTTVIAGTYDPKEEAGREAQELKEMNAQAKLVEAVRNAAEANDGPGLLAAVKKVLDADSTKESEMMPYQFEGLALTDVPAALTYLKEWSKGHGLDQEPMNAYEAWLIVTHRSIELSKEDWVFMAGLLDRCNARVTPMNPVIASAEAAAYARSGDPAKAAEWQKKALELAAGRDDGSREWIERHQKKLAEYQKAAGLEVTPVVMKRGRMPNPQKPEMDAEDDKPEDKEPTEQDVPGIKLIGKPAPNFTLNDLDGKKVSLADLKGSVVVLDFWATWCGPCMESLPGLDAVYRELGSSGLKVFALNQKESSAKIRATMAKLQLSLPILLDADGKVSDQFLVKGIPHAVVIGRDGKVLKVFVGSGREDKIRNAALKGLGITERFALKSKLPLVNDDTIFDQMDKSFKKLGDTGRLVDGQTLMRQLVAAAGQPMAIPSAKIVPALPADKTDLAPDLYERSRASILTIAGVRNKPSRDIFFTASGFVVTASGVAVTNYHVIESTREGDGLIAMTSDGRAAAVRSVIAADRTTDIAILQLDGDGFTPLALAESAPVGAPVAVISHPQNHFYMFTRGVVSRYCLRRYSQQDPYPTPIMEITADYAIGSSGGPLLDAEGRVIGMVCSTDSVYFGEINGVPQNLQMVFKDSIPSELIIALLRGQRLKMLDTSETASTSRR